MPHHFASTLVTLEHLLDFLDRLIAKLGEANAYHCIAGRHASEFAKSAVSVCELLLDNTRIPVDESVDINDGEKSGEESGAQTSVDKALELARDLSEDIDLAAVQELVQVCADRMASPEWVDELEAIKSIDKSKFDFSDLSQLVDEYPDLLRSLLDGERSPINLDSNIADILDILVPD